MAPMLPLLLPLLLWRWQEAAGPLLL